jgi:hypothetical protein
MSRTIYVDSISIFLDWLRGAEDGSANPIQPASHDLQRFTGLWLFISEAFAKHSQQ